MMLAAHPSPKCCDLPQKKKKKSLKRRRARDTTGDFIVSVLLPVDMEMCTYHRQNHKTS